MIFFKVSMFLKMFVHEVESVKKEGLSADLNTSHLNNQLWIQAFKNVS